jgi:TM2 domain-containing membrane protein YozV
MATVQTTATAARAPRNRGKFIALGLFLGGFGVHNFYAGYHVKGAAQLIISIALGWIFVGFLITGIWALVDVCTVKVDANGIPMV